ncbi:hypothetical protein [Cupriavidus sp. BIC8F]|uniref:hypothetical protein n=1 Tax=Cupriavidus sp. BIC8F TaxID=3079014 RepID=UPI002916B683|nr:hypothetical protein [Cupriavidus sp. BIC8F]
MLLSILSLLGGGLLRLLPEVFSFMNKKTDNEHELAMMDKQFALEQLKGANQQALVETQLNAEQIVHMFDAQAEALKSQMQVTGDKLVDGLNFLVRPLTTYYFLLLYGAAKVAMFVLALQGGISGWDAILKLYTDQDANILAGILGFWFVGRTFEKKQ